MNYEILILINFVSIYISLYYLFRKIETVEQRMGFELRSLESLVKKNSCDLMKIKLNEAKENELY